MPVVVVDFEGRKIGLEVEKILGTREVVIKSLSRHYQEIDGLIGASILGNGKIALIVDVETLIRQHYHAAGTNGRSGQKGIVDIEAREDASPEPARALVLEPAKPVSQAPAAAASVSAPSPAAEPSAASEENSGAEQDIGELSRKVINSQGTPLEEVNNTSAIQASMSLSQFTGHEIRVSFPESRLPGRPTWPTPWGGKRHRRRHLRRREGRPAGGMLLVLPFANLLEMDDLVHGRPAGTVQDLSSVDLSALCELGNILSSCFINTMADSTRLTVIPGVPEISIDMCLPVIDSVLARFNQPGDEILMTEAIIYGGVRKHGVPPDAFPGAGFPAKAHGRPRDEGCRCERRRHDMGGETVTVRMAEMDMVENSHSLKTILGSCVGVILRDPHRRVSGLAHIMLPEQGATRRPRGKYADTAMPALLAMRRQRRPSRLAARLSYSAAHRCSPWQPRASHRSATRT